VPRDGNVDASIKGPFWHRVHRNGGTPAGTKYATKLGETAQRIGEEHQSKAAHDGIETIVGE
jgi:hypothetical protein